MSAKSRLDDGPAGADRIVVHYRLQAGGAQAERLARKIAFEQTVELPEDLVRDRRLLEEVVGRVERLAADPAGDGRSVAVISYAAALTSYQIPQLLNLVFGNASIFPGVRVVDLELPPAVLDAFAGPGHGIAGVRRLLGVHGRPLLATAIKPRGAPLEDLARIAGRFAAGGGDIIKDDQNLVDDFESFKRRVHACQAEVARANEATGRGCLYFPHVSAPHAELERYFAFVREAGLKGVLLCPMILGLETARSLAAEHGLVLMAHPALSGSYTNSEVQGIAHEVLLGTLFRVAGADISIFPNAGGRFAFTREQCLAIGSRLREPLGGLRTAWPAPAGGMGYESLPAMCEDYGADTVLLIGGALLGHSPDLAGSTRAFLDRLREHFDETLTAPDAEAREESEEERALRFLPLLEGFEWAGRQSTPYKDDDHGSFKGVRRVELIGKHGERTACDLRYFEVEPGGFTSRERHLHTHIIIGARGSGWLELGNRRLAIGPFDIAYVRPLETHQLRNETAEPFGFLCIVDHRRDRPERS